MIKYISSKKNKIVLETIELRKNKIQQEKKMFIIEGEHLFEMALKAKNLVYVLVNKIIENLDEDIVQYIVDDDILKKISVNKSTPNIIAVCNYLKEDVEMNGNIVYLDGIQDPGNLGTILRNCLAFSIFNIVLSKNCVNKYNEKAIQSSQGAIFRLNIATKNIDFLKEIKLKGYKIISTILDNEAIKLNDFSYDGLMVFVFGNEGQGISKEIKEISDYKVFIEMNNIDSLNVGVAAGITLYKFAKK